MLLLCCKNGVSSLTWVRLFTLFDNETTSKFELDYNLPFCPSNIGTKNANTVAICNTNKNLSSSNANTGSTNTNTGTQIQISHYQYEYRYCQYI